MVPGTFRKKPRVNRCLVCKDGRCGQIDDALSATRVNVSALARQFDYPLHQMKRHRDNCLPLRRPAEVAQVAPSSEPEPEADDIAGQINSLFRKSKRLLDRTEKTGSVREVAAVMKECRNSIETMAKLAREVDQVAKVNVFASPAWLKVQGRIVAALDDHPDAQLAVLKALDPANVPLLT